MTRMKTIALIDTRLEVPGISLGILVSTHPDVMAAFAANDVFQKAGPKVWLTPGSISVAVDRLVKKGLVSRKDHPDDRRVRQVELTPKGRALISRGFGEHAAAMEDVAIVLSKNERLTLLRLLKKLGKHAAETRK
jgi:DNA-binding MarR family transcriptional regulator